MQCRQLSIKLFIILTDKQQKSEHNAHYKTTKELSLFYQSPNKYPRSLLSKEEKDE